MVKCAECKAKISSQATVCPHCGAPVVAKPAGKGRLWLMAGLVGVVLIAAAINQTQQDGAPVAQATATPAPQPKPYTMSDALALCQEAIKYWSKDPERAQVPFVPGSDMGNTYAFAWTKEGKLLRLRNGLGNEVASVGSCIVSKADQEVERLQIGDQVFTKK